MATYCIGNFINDPSPNDRLMYIYNCSGQLTVTIDPYASTFFQKSRYVYVVTDGKMNYDNVFDFATDIESSQAVARLNDVKKIFIDRTNNTLSGCVNLVSKCEFYNHTGDTILHNSLDVHNALVNSNNPSILNVYATINDIAQASGDTKQTKVSSIDDSAGFLIEKITGSTYITLEKLNSGFYEILKIDTNGLTPLIDFYNHTANTNLHLLINQKNALDNANNPSLLNPLATISDIQLATTGLTIPVADARYVKQTGDTMTGSLIINANLTVTGLTKVHNLELESGVTVNTISDDSGLTNSSTTALVTEQAIKKYVDNSGYYTLETSINSNVLIAQDLLRNNGIPTNISPFIIPYDSIISEISISTKHNNTWTGTTYMNNSIIRSFSIENQDNLVIKELNTIVSEGSKIRIRIENINGIVEYPSIKIFLKKINK